MYRKFPPAFCTGLLAGLSLFYLPNARADELEIHDLLKMDLSALMDVEVSSPGKIAGKLRNAAAIVRVVDGADLRRSGARTLSEVLWRIAGVQVTIRSNGRHSAWFRGVQTEFNNKVALLVDDIPYRDIFGGFNMDREIPLDNVKRIEIIRGPGSALYGSNAFAGVISVYTYAPGEKNRNNALHLESGNHGSRAGYFRVEAELAPGLVQIQGRHFESDGQAPLYDRKGNTDNTDSDRQTLDYLQAKAVSYDGKLQLNALFGSFDRLNVLKGKNQPSTRTYDRYALSLNFRHPFSEAAEMRTHAYYTRYDRRENETFLAANGSIDDAFLFQDNSALLGLNSIFTYVLNPRHNLLFGLDYQRDKVLDSDYLFNGVRDSFITAPEYAGIAVNNTGIYVQSTHAWDDGNLVLTLGMRYDILDLFNNQFSYRMGLIKHFNPRFSAKFLYGTAYRAASFVEYTRNDATVALPDVETMKTWETELTYSSDAFHTAVTVFRNEYDDFIRRAADSSVLFSGLGETSEQFINTNDQSIYGVEWESRFNLGRQVQVFANLAWIHTQDKQTGQAIPLLADWTATLGIDWDIPVKQGVWSLHNQVAVYSERTDWPQDTWDEGQQQRYPSRSPDFSDGFAVWSAGLRFHATTENWRGFEAALLVNNVLNKEYYTQSSTPPRPNRIAAFDTQYEQREIYLSVSYHW